MATSLPMMPLSRCLSCGRMVSGRCDCRPAWRAVDAPPPPRIRGRRLQQLRADLFARQPWCVTCLAAGKQTPATIRDHVRNLAAGGRDDESNVQALCQSCSDAKTHAEALRGRSNVHGDSNIARTGRPGNHPGGVLSGGQKWEPSIG